MTSRPSGPLRTGGRRHVDRCPSCGHRPTTSGEAELQRLDLQVLWLTAHPAAPGGVVQIRHCHACQPDAAYDVACRRCGDGPMLADDLAEQATARAAAGNDLPAAVTTWLGQHGWRPARDGSGWVCCA